MSIDESLGLYVTCEWTAEDFYESREKESGKLEENLCAEASTWNYVRRQDQRLWSHAIRFVHPDAKVNSYVDKVSSPFSKTTFPVCLERTRILPCCTTTAPETAATVQWLENFGHSFIPTWDWPAESPDLSSVDYSVNGIFKRRL